MKVAFYSTSDEDLFLYRLPVARLLREAGYEIFFFVPRGEFLGRIAGNGFDVTPLGAPSARPNTLLDIAFGVRLGRLYLRKKPDIVHHFGKRAVVHGGIAARVAHIDWVVNSISDLGPACEDRHVPWRLLKFAVDESEVTVARPWEREQLISYGCVRPQQANVLGSTAVDLASLPFRQEPDRKPVVVFVGPYTEASTFVEATHLLLSEGIDARFAVMMAAGSPGDAEQLQILQEEGVVEWWRRRGELSDSLSNAHVVCVASFGDLEEIVMSAAAAGRPIVAAAGTDLAPNTGLVVEAGDTRGMAGAIRRLIDDTNLRRRLGRHARQLFDDTYSPIRVAREFMLVYERLFERGRRV